MQAQFFLLCIHLYCNINKSFPPETYNKSFRRLLELEYRMLLVPKPLNYNRINSQLENFLLLLHISLSEPTDSLCA